MLVVLPIRINMFVSSHKKVNYLAKYLKIWNVTRKLQGPVVKTISLSMESTLYSTNLLLGSKITPIMQILSFICPT